jgi:hypothetical protein
MRSNEIWMELFRLIWLVASGRTDKKRSHGFSQAVSAGEGKPRKSADQILFGVLAPKDRSHDQTQNADSGHHFQDDWDAEFTL